MIKAVNTDKFLNARLLVYILLSGVMFTPLFVYRQIGSLDFWWWMSANLIVLIGSAFFTDNSYLKTVSKDLKTDVGKKFLYGVISAVILYFVFLFGNSIIGYIISFASDNIDAVYGFKGEATDLRITILMLLVIGPGEELFWRAYLQNKLSAKFGKVPGFIIATVLYTAVHIATGNLVLVLAALVCGIFWGYLYMKYNSVLLNMFSHTLWDIGVFILFPFI